ncbi:unnamed protein product [Schistosoma mattheei]|uniref:Uncharacterized protein n=1 Tax=Schistosoma mattheei TaxID=31246 RepID=A0A3P8FUF4_9TREM|nr:unnamed protein product [Schistosoma mattheei]
MSRTTKFASYCASNGFLNIRRIKNNKRSITAHFQKNAFTIISSFGVKHRSHFCRASKSN